MTPMNTDAKLPKGFICVHLRHLWMKMVLEKTVRLHECVWSLAGLPKLCGSLCLLCNFLFHPFGCGCAALRNLWIKTNAI